MEVEPLHVGHDEQQSEQNALPKQHAIDEPSEPRQRPIVERVDLNRRKIFDHREHEIQLLFIEQSHRCFLSRKAHKDNLHMMINMKLLIRES